MGEILTINYSIKNITDKAAELFDFPAYPFYVQVEGNKKLKNAIMKHDMAFYEEALKQINAISDEDGSTKVFERAKLQRIVFGEAGITSEDLVWMCERMDDMYYR